MTILKDEVLAITDSRAAYEEAGDYYEGDVGERFSTRHLRRLFRSSGYDSTLNFCRPVVDSVSNRIEIASIIGSTKAASKVIDETFEFNELATDANEIHRKALVYGDCYAMVWPDEDGNLEIAYHSPLTTAIVYDPERPRKKLYAVHMWETDDGTRMNIYYDDKIVKWGTKGKEVTEGAQWFVLDTMENPFGEIPVFHFRAGGKPYGRPEHKDAYDAQDYINKQFIQSMYVADYQGAPQRYALSQAGQGSEAEDFSEGDTERENIGSLKNGPGELWYLKGVSSVGQFSPANPEVFWQPIKDTVRSMASLTNTPLHYFEKTGNVPSGESLRVAEAPLIKKVRDRQELFAQAWRQLFKFVLKANGIDADVQVKWQMNESLDELERWDLALKKRNTGLSTAQTMREMGYDEEVIKNTLEEAKAERDANPGTTYQRAPVVRVQPQNDERNVDATTSTNGL